MKQVIFVVLLCIGLASAVNLIQFGTREPGDVEIFRISNSSLATDEIQFHATYFRWEQHGGSQYTGGEILVNKVSLRLDCIVTMKM